MAEQLETLRQPFARPSLDTKSEHVEAAAIPPDKPKPMSPNLVVQTQTPYSIFTTPQKYLIIVLGSSSEPLSPASGSVEDAAE